MNAVVEPQAAPLLDAPQAHRSQVVVTPMDLLQMAMAQGADLDRLERLMKMKQEFEADEARKAFRRDFAALRGENIIVPKTKFVDRGKAGSFWQAEFSEMCNLLSPAMSRHGFSFRHDQQFGSKRWMTDGVESDVPWVTVTCYLEHAAGHVEKLTLEGPPGEQSANTPVQNMQMTATVLKRQSLAAITGTATADEDDEGKLKRGGKGGDQRSEADQSAADELLDIGRDKALQGTKVLTAWWASLAGGQRDLLMGEFGSLKKAAAKSDADGGAK